MQQRFAQTRVIWDTDEIFLQEGIIVPYHQITREERYTLATLRKQRQRSRKPRSPNSWVEIGARSTARCGATPRILMARTGGSEPRKRQTGDGDGQGSTVSSDLGSGA